MTMENKPHQASWLGPRLKVLLKLVGLFMGFFVILRAVFYLYFSPTADAFPAGDLYKALYLGLKFDLRVALTFLLPLALLMGFPWFHPSDRGRKKWLLFYTGVFAFLLFFYFTDFGYYSYLESRVNATILDFLKNPLISGGMMWQTYPVGWALSGLFAFSVFVYWFLARFVFIEEPRPKPRPLGHRALITSVVAVFFLLGLYGRLSAYPLRWSEAFFSGNSFVSALAMNPVHYFFDTLRKRTKTFDVNQVRYYYEKVAEYLSVIQPNPDTLTFSRPVALTPEILKTQGPKPPNIVIIVMESFAYFKTGIGGHPLNPTPAFDELAKQGWLFNQYYVPSEATARSLFCLVTGIPDVSSGSTSSRNPLIVNQHTVANAFSDYDKFYYIGGSANWGNIRGIYGFNVIGLKIFEEGMFESPRADVWGISDLNLFEEAHKHFKARGQDDKPFFAFIQTAGFHRPYTIPEDKRDFEIKDLDSDEAKKYGFVSSDEYNSLRFSDFALQRFFELAKDSPYFDNTLFVIIGDHGLPDLSAVHVPEGHKIFGLERFHTPLVFYAPKLLGEPKVISTMATEPDILPTLAGITNHPFINTTLGSNLFAPQKNRYAFTYVYYRNPPEIGLLDDEFYVTGTPGKVRGLFRYKSPTPEADVSRDHPEKFEEMTELLFGLYETSKYMLYNNPSLVRSGQL